MKKIILTFLGLICFEQIASAQAQEEKILGYQPSDSGLSFHVTSGGCTKLEDFMIQLAPNKETGVKRDRQRLDLERYQPHTRATALKSQSIRKAFGLIRRIKTTRCSMKAITNTVFLIWLKVTVNFCIHLI